MTRHYLLPLLLCAGQLAHAGGPLILEGPTGNTPVSYSGAVTLNFDQGPLLFTQTNSQADTLVLQALAEWNDVATATVQINQGSDLATDIDSTNYTTVFDDAPNSPTYSDNISPVIYDADGGIIDDFFGSGQSDFIAGFAASIYLVNGTEFEEGYAIINGKPSAGFSSDDIVKVTIHEIGHLIGLDHSQLDINNQESMTLVCRTAAATDYPAMYPFLCRNTLDLHPDDIQAVSALYPVADLTSQWGQLAGVFLDPGDNPILGANLWVEETTSGATYSIVSDYLMQSNGAFSLYLPPGDYTLHANSINDLFFGASSVGPYANTSSDVSFLAPHPIPEVEYQADTGSTVSMNVVVGERVQVTFRSDGTGSNTGGNSIIDPAAVVSSSSSSGGSSDIGYLTLLLLLPLLSLRGRAST